MALIRCRMCGGETEVPLGASTVECEYCGEKLTLEREELRKPTMPADIGGTGTDKANAEKDTLYAAGRAYMRPRVESIQSYEAAIAAFEKIPGWKDADEQICICQGKIAELKAKEEDRRLKQQRLAELAHAKRQKRLRRLKMLVYIGVPAVCVLIAVALVLQWVVFPEVKKKNFIEAYGQAVYDRFGVVEEGAYLELGTYEQDNRDTNGKEEIEWLVLEVQDGKALVVSRYGLIFLPYHTVEEDITWEHCSLRQWLNNDFFSAVFTAEEAALIPTVTVPADPSPEYDTDPGNPTQDRIFLLSAAEAERYFSSDKARRCVATEMAENERKFSSGNTGSYDWWLRTPGDQQNQVATISAVGHIQTRFGFSVDYLRPAVRPAMWIDFSSVGK